MNDTSTETSNPTPQEPKVPPAPKGTETKVRIAHLWEMKRIGRPIVMVTAYDACFSQIADEAGVDMILVGDTLGMVVHGHETTLPVTMDMMVMHTAAVTRGSRRAFVVADMPFMSYQASVEDAVRNAGRLVQESGAQAVKLEGHSDRVLDAIKAIVDSGIPVVGHVGLLPQSVHAMSGYRVQGKTAEDAERIKLMAKAQEECGAFAVVLECVPRELSRQISQELKIPTIGIGAGDGCDGQVLVMQDLLGLTEKPPRFIKKYVDLRAGALRAFRKYARDVREHLYPEEEHWY